MWHCGLGGEQNHSSSYPEMDRGRRGLCRLSQHGFIIMTLSSLDLSAREGSISSETFLITAFIVRRPSYDRFTASSKARFPHNAIQCFLFKFQVSSSLLKVILYLLTSSSSSSRHYNSVIYLPFKNMFLLPESSKPCSEIGISLYPVQYQNYKLITL
jgi:hypothetical protein